MSGDDVFMLIVLLLVVALGFSSGSSTPEERHTLVSPDTVWVEMPCSDFSDRPLAPCDGRVVVITLTPQP